jgi:hypothetical protein
LQNVKCNVEARQTLVWGWEAYSKLLERLRTLDGSIVSVTVETSSQTALAGGKVLVLACPPDLRPS